MLGEQVSDQVLDGDSGEQGPMTSEGTGEKGTGEAEPAAFQLG